MFALQLTCENQTHKYNNINGLPSPPPMRSPWGPVRSPVRRCVTSLSALTPVWSVSVMMTENYSPVLELKSPGKLLTRVRRARRLRLSWVRTTMLRVKLTGTSTAPTPRLISKVLTGLHYTDQDIFYHLLHAIWTVDSCLYLNLSPGF